MPKKQGDSPELPDQTPGTDPVAEKIAETNIAFQAHVDEVAAAVKKFIEAGCQSATAAETAFKMWMHSHFG